MAKKGNKYPHPDPPEKSIGGPPKYPEGWRWPKPEWADD